MIPLLKEIRVRNWPLFLLASNLILPSFSSGSVLAEPSSQHPPEIVKGETEQGVPFMTGGIGEGEREIMESWGADYNLKLTLAELSGNYLSDVRIVIQDPKGKEIISTVSNGPWLYVQLTPGSYDVKATLEGETREIKNLRVPEGERVSRFLHWDLD